MTQMTVNSHGITDGEPGFSVLIKFQGSIEEVYHVSSRTYPPNSQI